MPQSRIAQEFLQYCQTPIVAPSANLSGKPSPTNWQAVFADLDGRIECILQGDEAEIGLESTVVDCSEEKPRILRLGAVTYEKLREVVENIEIYQPAPNEKVKSPGLKHRHYAPVAKVILCSKFPTVQSPKSNADAPINPPSATPNSKSKAFIGLDAPTNLAEFASVKICATIEIYAHEVFRFSRECDEKGISQIFCQMPEEKGLGRALADRLRRAAE
jgi:L-threonylcarbamoyladenylate synthase